MMGRSPRAGRRGELPCLALLFAVAAAPACAPVAPPMAAPRDPAPAFTLPREAETVGRTRWESCYSTFAPAGDAPGDLTRLVRDCGPTGGMRALTTVRSGDQSDQDAVDRYTFEVPSAGRCYRVYAAADRDVTDLDLLLRGPSGNPVASDVTHDSWPVLPARHPACFSEPGLYMLEVSVQKGKGHYALQVWGR